MFEKNGQITDICQKCLLCCFGQYNYDGTHIQGREKYVCCEESVRMGSLTTSYPSVPISKEDIKHF